MSSIIGVNDAIKELNGAMRVAKSTTTKTAMRGFADYGAAIAESIYDATDYDGDRDFTVTAVTTADGASVIASGSSVLFREFGSGLIGYGHPEARVNGYGPGTWSDGPSGKHHWNDPNGWYIPGTAHQKSYGNPPAMAMYQAGEEISREIDRTIREAIG